MIYCNWSAYETKKEPETVYSKPILAPPQQCNGGQYNFPYSFSEKIVFENQHTISVQPLQTKALNRSVGVKERRLIMTQRLFEN